MVVRTPLALPVHFVSDVHWPLRHDYPNGQPFLDFLDSLDGMGGTLILLGDIFDFWFEWRQVVPAYWFALLHRLRVLIEGGTEIWFICGNHDFLPGPYLSREIGLSVCPDHLDCQAGGRRFFVAHGDGLARRDRGYRVLKKLIRHPMSVWLYKNLFHPDWGMALARWTSYASRKHRQIDKAAWAEEYWDFARARLDEGFDHVVLGHLHYPELRSEGVKSYLNCGDWLGFFSYGHVDDEGLTLRYWTPSRGRP